MLKTTAGLVVAGAIGVGLGYGASELLRPTAPPGGITTVTETVTATGTGPAPQAGEQLFYNMYKEDGALRVFVKDGRVTRVEPFAGTKQNPMHLTDRYRTYSPHRIQYPMKRKGWEPGGKSDQSNRGKGEFVRISWEEAFTSVTSEIKRMLNTYGPSAFLYEPGEHSDSWMYHNRYLYVHDFFTLLGGYSSLGCDGYSWAASRSSGCSISGDQGRGLNPPEEISFFAEYSKMMVLWAVDPLINVIDNPDFQQTTEDMRLLKERGVKIVAITAGYEDTGREFADTWIPCHPHGDSALAAAIAYTWITEGTYDQKYLDTHAVGFDEQHLPKGAPAGSSFKNYILGTSDGVPKTPEWAEPICKVKPRIIRALAREWASGPTGLKSWRGANLDGGNYVRFMYTLLAMQGLGKPGVGGWATAGGLGGGGYGMTIDGIRCFPSVRSWGEAPFVFHDSPAIPFTSVGGGPGVYPFYHVIPPELADPKTTMLGLAFAGRWPGLAIARLKNPIVQYIRDVLFEVSMKADHEHPVYHRYNIGMDSVLYKYPLEGNSEVHMYIGAGGNLMARTANCNSVMRAFLSPKFEFILQLDPRWEPDLMFADIVLPTVTNFERNDISNYKNWSIYCSKCIPNLFESRSDRDVWEELAKRMDVWDKWAAGPDGKPLPTEDDWLRLIYEKTTSLPKHMTWEEFKKVGYFDFNTTMPPDWKPWTPYNWNWKQFWEDPTKAINPWKDPTMTPPWGLITESGLIEIYSASTAKIASWGQSGYYLNEDLTSDTQKYEQDNTKNPIPDPRAPVIPRALPNPEAEQYKTYPIAIESCHPKFYYHTTYQDVVWLEDEEKKEVNGRLYAPIWMNKKDADDRGIKYGDIVRVFNKRGQILCWARTSEQMMPSAGRVTYGYWNDYDEPGVPGSLDRSGNIENLCRGGFVSPFDTQTDVQCIAQVEKWSGSL